MSLQTLAKSLGRVAIAILLITAFFGGFHTFRGYAQDTVERKVKTKVAPVYPEIARKMSLTGIVRIQVVIAPNGTVKETKVIGGHPILVSAAVDAVKKWRFEPASAETTGTLEFKFEPGS